MHLIIQELVDDLIGASSRLVGITDAFALAQPHDNEGVGIVIVCILNMSIGHAFRIKLPANGATTVEKDIVVVVETAIGFACHINGHLNQIIWTGGCVQLRQHAAPIVVDAYLTRVKL